MSHRRAFATVVAAVVISPLLAVATATPAHAHGYISAPPSRQAHCAQGRAGDCGPIQYEPQSVEGPKGQRNCHGGVSQFAVLNDDSRAWPVTAVERQVSFQWTLTARHATSTWEYWIGSTKVAEFDDGGRQPGATVRHDVDLGSHTGRVKLLAIWNIADTPMAFYNCIDLQVGAPTTQPPTTPPPTTQPPTTQPPATTQPPTDSTWREGAAYAVGSQVSYAAAIYHCVQAHTALPGWEPPTTPALWQRG